jgi:hypothetical protein
MMRITIKKTRSNHASKSSSHQLVTLAMLFHSNHVDVDRDKVWYLCCYSCVVNSYCVVSSRYEYGDESLVVVVDVCDKIHSHSVVHIFCNTHYWNNLSQLQKMHSHHHGCEFGLLDRNYNFRHIETFESLIC